MGVKTRKFEKFHADNPAVYEALVRLAREWVKRTGRHKVGIASLFEVARWELSLATSDSEYKIANSHKPFYARLIMAQEKDLAGLFELRPAEADEWLVSRERLLFDLRGLHV